MLVLQHDAVTNVAVLRGLAGQADGEALDGAVGGLTTVRFSVHFIVITSLSLYVCSIRYVPFGYDKYSTVWSRCQV